MTAYLDTPEKWDAAIAACRRAGRFGLDTETYGHDVRETSPAHRAVVHVWSIGLALPRSSARGYPLARGAVLPAAALDYVGWCDLLGDSTVTKVLHNAGHDAHAIANRADLRTGSTAGAGRLCGWVDTLDAVRLVMPGRSGSTGGSGYDLKTLAVEVLCKLPRVTYAQLVGTELDREKSTLGACPHPEHDKASALVCKLRSRGHGRVRTTTVEKIKGPDIPLESILPGHPRWEMLLDYAAADAVDALELDAYLSLRQSEVRRPPVPWDPPASEQPCGQ